MCSREECHKNKYIPTVLIAWQSASFRISRFTHTHSVLKLDPTVWHLLNYHVCLYIDVLVNCHAENDADRGEQLIWKLTAWRGDEGRIGQGDDGKIWVHARVLKLSEAKKEQNKKTLKYASCGDVKDTDVTMKICESAQRSIACSKDSPINYRQYWDGCHPCFSLSSTACLMPLFATVFL